MADETARPGFLRRFSSKTKSVTARANPNRSRSPSLGSAIPDSKLSTGKILAPLSELTHGSNSTSGQHSRTGAIKDAAKNVGMGDKIIKPPDLLDLPENPVGRWYLHARAITLRQLAVVGFNLQNRADPPAPPPTRIRWIDSTLSAWSGKRKIQLDVWQPSAASKQKDGRACVVVFHGGGFVLGNGTDDSRWAGAVMDHLDAVVIAVNYRVAPGYPFPTPVEDCADGILHIAYNAKEYGIDPGKMFISGFSAGGNLAFASYYLLTSPSIWGYKILQQIPKIRGIIAYYPLLDFTIARKDKKASCSRPDFCLPDSMTGLFDQSYLHPPPDRSDARISPGLAPEELLEDLPPVHLCCCEWDMLITEGRAFRDRLEGMGKEVVWREVKEEKHGWDKPPPLTPKKSVLEEYVKAVESMKRWLGDQIEETIESAVRTRVGDDSEIALKGEDREHKEGVTMNRRDVRQALHEKAEKGALEGDDGANQVEPERTEGKVVRAMEKIREKTGAE